ncbi:MAG TPA: hypothetical protein VL992_07870 [Tepidisphaeraceae bacterium]|nr:hypothetical protein [Tepidisphaeraceae bacterium]
MIASGWKDFVDTDHPATNSPQEMAAQALLYLGFDDECWNQEVKLVIAIFAFLKEHCGDPIQEPKTLLVHLKKMPVASSAIIDWFKDAYPV